MYQIFFVVLIFNNNNDNNKIESERTSYVFILFSFHFNHDNRDEYYKIKHDLLNGIYIQLLRVCAQYFKIKV